MQPFFRYTCASIIRSPVMSRRSSIGDTVSRGSWSHAYQVTERVAVVMSSVVKESKGVTLRRKRSPGKRAGSGPERRLDLDVDVPLECARDGTAVAGLHGELLKRRIVDRRRDGSDLELDARDRHRVVDLLDGALRVRVDARRRRPVSLEGAAQRHAVARRLGGGQELFGIRARARLEARAERVLSAQSRRPRAASAARLESALPSCAGPACRHSRFPRGVTGFPRWTLICVRSKDANVVCIMR